MYFGEPGDFIVMLRDVQRYLASLPFSLRPLYSKDIVFGKTWIPEYGQMYYRSSWPVLRRHSESRPKYLEKAEHRRQFILFSRFVSVVLFSKDCVGAKSDYHNMCSKIGVSENIFTMVEIGGEGTAGRSLPF